MKTINKITIARLSSMTSLLFLLFCNSKSSSPTSTIENNIKNETHVSRIINNNDSMWIGVFVNIVDTIKWISDTIYKDTLNPGDTSNEFILKSDELYRIGEFGFDTLYNTFGSPFYSSVWTVAPFWPKMNDSTNYEYSVYYDKIVLRQFNK